MSLAKMRIGVVPIGEVPETASKAIAALLLECLQLEADVLPATEPPEYAYDENRFQYNAGTILQDLEFQSFHEHDKVIGLLDVDLFIPIFTHVFGEAKQGGKYGLVSLHRLKRNSDGSTVPATLLLERAAKVALHELGHLFDLLHCMDEKCLMHYSGNMQDLDKTPLDFCRYCAMYFRDALQNR